MKNELIKMLSKAQSKEEAKTLLDSYNNGTELSDEELNMVNGGFEELVPELECAICHIVNNTVHEYRWLPNAIICSSCAIRIITGIN